MIQNVNYSFDLNGPAIKQEAKGQCSSKANYDVFNSPKKRKKNPTLGRYHNTNY